MIPAMNRLTPMCALTATVALAAWCGHNAQSASAVPRTSVLTVNAASAVAAPPPREPIPAHTFRPPPPPRPPDPGTLPQTHVLPKANDPAFQIRARALWQAVIDDRPDEALPFFFPKAAYVQLKALQNAAQDYEYRLVGYYALDVHAAHNLLGRDAAQARFTGIDIPASDAEWMPPGSEENRISYYRVYGSRLTYTVAGHSRSFGIFSMLSWRGQWYAVHFGPWPRWERYGAVDDPR
jgi:hypothetical protein